LAEEEVLMRGAAFGLALWALAASSPAQHGRQLPRLTQAQIGPVPWNVQSGGIAACDVTLAESGAVVAVDLVQDVPPYGAQLREAIRSWGFEPAQQNDRPIGARVLVLGFFHPPTLHIPTPENPRYKGTKAPDEIPWPTHVTVPPYTPNVLVVESGKVIVEADISDQGAVASARVLNPGSPFDSGVLDALRKWTFRPAAHAGRPVPSRAFFVFSFPTATL
jgi:TonB family protein